MSVRYSRKGAPLKNHVVFQHNNLIEARYTLNLQEKRIIFLLMSEINPNDHILKKHYLKIEELIRLVGLKGQSAYSEIKRITLNLIKKELTVERVDKSEKLQTNWLSCAEYKDNEGIVGLAINSHLRPFLLQLRGHYTILQREAVLKIKSVYGVRLYELLKQKETFRSRDFDLEDLRYFCGIDDSTYSRYVDFKRRVLEIAKREINDKTDIRVEYEEIKHGRKVKGIRFKIMSNPSYFETKEERERKQFLKHLQEENKARNPIIERLQNIGLARSTAYKLLKDYSNEPVERALEVVETQMLKGNARHPKALFRQALREGWSVNVFKKRA